MNDRNPYFKSAYNKHLRSNAAGNLSLISLEILSPPYPHARGWRGLAQLFPTAAFKDESGNFYATGSIFHKEDNVFRLDFDKQTFAVVTKLGSATFETVGKRLAELLFFTNPGDTFKYGGMTFTALDFDPDVWDGSTFFLELEAAQKHDPIEPFDIEVVYKTKEGLTKQTYVCYGIYRDNQDRLLVQLHDPTNRNYQQWLIPFACQTKDGWVIFKGPRDNSDCVVKNTRLLQLGVTGIHTSFGFSSQTEMDYVYILTSAEVDAWKELQGGKPLCLDVSPETWETYQRLSSFDPLSDTYLRSYQLARRTGNVEGAREALTKYRAETQEYLAQLDQLIASMDQNDGSKYEV